MFFSLMFAAICCLLHMAQAIHPELLPWSKWDQDVGNLSPLASHNRYPLFHMLSLFLQEKKWKRGSVSVSLTVLSPSAPLTVSDCIMKGAFQHGLVSL